MAEVMKKPNVYAGVKNRARKLKRYGYYGPPVKIKKPEKYLNSCLLRRFSV